MSEIESSNDNNFHFSALHRPIKMQNNSSATKIDQNGYLHPAPAEPIYVSANYRQIFKQPATLRPEIHFVLLGGVFVTFLIDFLIKKIQNTEYSMVREWMYNFCIWSVRIGWFILAENLNLTLSDFDRVPFQVDTSPTISDHFQLFLYQSIALDEGYISSFVYKSIRAAFWPEIHGKVSWVGVFLRHLRGFDVILRPNTRSNRLGLKKHFIERFKSYRTVCSFVELDKKQPR